MSERSDLALLLEVLDAPARGLSARQWNTVLAQARKHALTARLAEALAARGVNELIPAKARRHLKAAAIGCESSHTAVAFEFDQVARALENAGVRVKPVALKGGAYLLAGLSAGRGRPIGDLDLMVPFDQVDAVERALVQAGWTPSEVDDYDQTYYRQWMHEVPPLQHPKRQTPVDLHHTILPRTARARPDAQALLDAAVETRGGRARVLAPADMFLHSAVHLFHGESGHPLRDLLDQRALIAQFSGDPEFWDTLLAHAATHDLRRTLYYALRYAQRVVAVPVPAPAREAVARWGPAPPLRWLMDRVFDAYFLSAGMPGTGPLQRTLNALLLIRSHWLKMPAPLLARHLAAKSMKRYRDWRAAAKKKRPG